MKWRDVYSREVRCGEFAEIRIWIRPRVNLTLQDIDLIPHHPVVMPYYKEKCESWLMLTDENYCVNVDGHAFAGWLSPEQSTDFDKATWCYVSKECKDLNGGQEISDKVDSDGKVLPRRVSAKLCKRGTDRLLRDLSIQELQSQVAQLRKEWPARAEVLTLGYMALEAYKALLPSIEDYRWERVVAVWRQAARAPDALPGTLVQAMKDEEPVVIHVGSFENHNNYKLVVGKKIYSLDIMPKRVFFGLLPIRERACPDTVHCLRETTHDEL